MIEKSFDKIYAVSVKGVSQTALTRAANRLIAEYTAVFGGWSIPDEIKAIAEAIKAGAGAEEYCDELRYENDGVGERIYDKVEYSNEASANAFWDTDDYNDPVYHVTWYFFASEYYSKKIGSKTLHASSYNEILRKGAEAKGKYRYFCTHRPPSAGCIPAGYVSYDTYSQRQRYLGEVTYNEEPPENDLYNWGLVEDSDWERQRAAYMQIGG